MVRIMIGNKPEKDFCRCRSNRSIFRQKLESDRKGNRRKDLMSNDHSRIRVGDHEVGLIGLRTAIEEIAQSHAERTDEEVRQALLDKLSKSNYIPTGASSDYGNAFVREFRKFLGQPYQEEADSLLRIVVVGQGCSQCDRLTQAVMQVLNEMSLPASLEHVADIKEMARFGFVATPALVINGKICSKGTIPSAKKIKEWLGEASRAASAKTTF